MARAARRSLRAAGRLRRRPGGDHLRQQPVLRDLVPRGRRSRRDRRAAQPGEPGRRARARDRRGPPASVIIGPSATTAWSQIGDGPARRSPPSCSPEGDAPAGVVPLAELLQAEPMPAVDVDRDHLAVMMFTSGTAGPPRAAMLSHGNLLANIEQTLSVRDRTRDPTTSSTACCRCSTSSVSTSCSACRSPSAPRWCSCNGSTRRPRSSRSRNGVTIVPGARRCGSAFATSTPSPDDAFAPSGSRCRARHRSPRSCRRAMPWRPLRRHDPRGLRPHRGGARRDQLDRHADPPGSVGVLVAVTRCASSVMTARTGPRRRRRDLGPRSQRLPGLLERSEEATARVLAPTGGCAPATSPSPTTTATSTSSTAPRT